MVGAYISLVVNQGAEQNIRRRFDHLARAQIGQSTWRDPAMTIGPERCRDEHVLDPKLKSHSGAGSTGVDTTSQLGRQTAVGGLMARLSSRSTVLSLS